MELCHSYQHRPIPLRSTRRYSDDEIRILCNRVTGPFWLWVEGKLIPLEGEMALQLACKVSAAYHDWVAYNAPEDDGFQEDMEEREKK